MQNSQPSVLVAHEIQKTFYDGQEPTAALAGVTFQAHAGEFVCIVGPSGCGKSTLLRILGGLEVPTAGEVRFHGHRLVGPRREIGFVFQKTNLMPWRTVLDNITLPLEIEGFDRVTTRERARRLIELIGLQGFEGAYPRQLSGGMGQRVVLARALIHKPSVLLLDEPFASLDALTRERMNLELLRIWRLQRQTVVMITHSIQEAVFLGDRVLVMGSRPGRIVAEVVVPLPRPRDIELLAEEAFIELAQRVRLAIGTS
ncbi:MAG TPA: ABC transporter ATP-binding protein [Anaerolineae bacterium]|nr:ABC transporter ATP-binding protein [Anaerolineae bacterium]HIQ05384.1 ABC transporter ATP-binding protein [Anaerolineae bacterium]